MTLFVKAHAFLKNGEITCLSVPLLLPVPAPVHTSNRARLNSNAGARMDLIFIILEYEIFSLSTFPGLGKMKI